MKQRISSLPVLVVVAVIALVLGSFGTAVGAPAMTKSKVKKIATKVVKKEAPGLSVAHATTANTATTATTAGNATNLNGLSATTYLDRVAQASVDAGSPIAVSTGADTQILGPLNLTVPAGVNFAHASANVTFAGGASTLYMYVSQDAVCGAASTGFTNRVFSSDNPTQNDVSFSLVFPATPGVHVYRVCALAGAAAMSAFNRSLVVDTIATGATGGSTITRPADSGQLTDADHNPTTPN